ncbi:hypothetical protein NDA10_005300 [Ustilago hordei]|nr:hypothetical protein NDA10_005300 [Ustilago hordei]KAJ1586992.1 hypothetical protein NDA15_000880 [Ustilago hordei]KAJ1589974.1 hypothetical protein NDA12_002683 [Ustilago hordei]
MDENSRASEARKLPQTAANFFVGTNSRVPRMTLAQSSHIIPMPMSATSSAFPSSKTVLSRLRPTPFPNSTSTAKPPSSPRYLAKQGGKVAKAVQHFSKAAEDEEEVASIDPVIPTTESVIQQTRQTQQTQQTQQTSTSTRDDSASMTTTSAVAVESIPLASSKSQEAQPSDLDVILQNSTTAGQNSRMTTEAQTLTDNSSPQQSMKETQSLTPTDNSVLFSAGSSFTRPARSSHSRPASQCEAINPAHQLSTQTSSSESHVKAHDPSPQRVNHSGVETFLASSAGHETTSLLLSSKEPPNFTWQTDQTSITSQAAHIEGLFPSSAQDGAEKSMHLASSTSQKPLPAQRELITADTTTQETQESLSRSQVSLASLPSTISTTAPHHPSSTLKSAFSDSTDPTASPNPFDRLPCRAATRTSQSMGKVAEDHVGTADPSLERSGPSHQNGTVPGKATDPNAVRESGGAEIPDAAEIVERLDTDSESDASWEDGLLDRVYADSEQSFPQEILQASPSGPTGPSDHLVIGEVIELVSAGGKNARAFFPTDVHPVPEDQQSAHAEQSVAPFYASSSGNEEILAELIDEVEDADMEPYVKPRDSLIERTTSWLKHTMVEAVNSSSDDGDADIHTAADSTLLELADTERQVEAKPQSTHNAPGEVLLQPFSGVSALGASDSDAVEKDEGIHRHVNRLEQASPPQPLNDRPLLGQKLSRSFSQRKKLGQTSFKPIKIPGRLNIPQREPDLVASRPRQESLHLLPALNKSKRPALEEQPRQKVDVTNQGDLQCLLLARSQPGAKVAEPVTPSTRQQVGRMVKDWDDSEEEEAEVASVGVARRMTLKRMSGFTVHGSPRRELKILPGKLRQREEVVDTEDIALPAKQTKRTLLKQMPDLNAHSKPQHIQRKSPGKLTRRAVEVSGSEEPQTKRMLLKTLHNIDSPAVSQLPPGKLAPQPTKVGFDTEEQPRPMPGKLRQPNMEPASPTKPTRPLPGKLAHHKQEESQSDAEDQRRPLPGKLARDALTTETASSRTSRPIPGKLSIAAVESEPGLVEKQGSSPGKLSPWVVEDATSARVPQPSPCKLSSWLAEETTAEKDWSPPGKLKRHPEEAVSPKEPRSLPGKLPRYDAHPTSGAALPEPRSAPGRLARDSVEQKSGSAGESRSLPGKLQPRVAQVSTLEKPRSTPGKLSRQAFKPEPAQASRPILGKLPTYEPESPRSSEVRSSHDKLPDHIFEQPSSVERRSRPSPGKLSQHLFEPAPTVELQPVLRPLRNLVHTYETPLPPEKTKSMIVRRKRAPTMAAFANERPSLQYSSLASAQEPLPASDQQVEPQEILQPQVGAAISEHPSSPCVQQAPTTTPRSDTSRLLKPLRLATSSSTFSTPRRRPDASVTDTSPRTVTSELWTPNTSNPAHSAVTEESCVTGSMGSAQTRQANLQGHKVGARDRRAEVFGTFYEGVPGRGRSHTMQRSPNRPKGGVVNRPRSPHAHLDMRNDFEYGHAEGQSNQGTHYRGNYHRLEPNRSIPAHAAEAYPSAASTGAGFDISFSLTHPNITPHRADGTLLEFGLRVHIRPTLTSPSASQHYRTKVQVSPEQYEYSNLPQEEMSRVQEDAQEYLLHRFVSPLHRQRSGTNEAYRDLGLSSPFLAADHKRAYGGGGSSRGTSATHATRSDGNEVAGVSPMSRRARQTSSATGLVSPLPYIKRASARMVNSYSSASFTYT